MNNEHLIDHKQVLPNFVAKYCNRHLFPSSKILKVGGNSYPNLQHKIPNCFIIEYKLEDTITPDLHWDLVFAPDILNYQKSHSQLRYILNILKIFTEISKVFVNYLPYDRKLGLTPKQLRLRISDMTDLKVKDAHKMATYHYNTGKEKKMTTYVWELKR